MRRVGGIFVALALVLAATPVRAEISEVEEFNEFEEAPPLAPKAEMETPSQGELRGTLADSQLLLLGARVDSLFVAGGTVQQGFSIPSVRLTANGEIGKYIGYRLSFGQAKEWTSVLLPQVVPVEAYVDVHSSIDGGMGLDSALRWRSGMFTPTFNPWWSPDLSDLPLPDYHSVHRSLLLGREIGTELVFEPSGGAMGFSLGVFNGNGIYGPNTNSARAFVGSARATINEGGTTKFSVGAALYSLQQASAGSANFRRNLMGNVYLWLEIVPWAAELTAEVLSGRLEDSSTIANPFGGAVTLTLGFGTWAKLFARGEFVDGLATGSGRLEHYQLGPVLHFHRNLQVYVLFDHTFESTTAENQGLVRMRLGI